LNKIIFHLNAVYDGTEIEKEGEKSTSRSHEMKQKKHYAIIFFSFLSFSSYQRVSLLNFRFLMSKKATEEREAFEKEKKKFKKKFNLLYK
jgi:hypothetical protein